eukprot:TRINITY_DN3604_c0_g1_i12.p4 TRINITY_DN3604_c0_g1~~TRINITY_DN3604_c0_g1_i12.p4  ORF type:complete len:100 (-),score=16.13 TRINITY_DN3604_c0_g1_i12:973-1272(-)
MCIRDSAYTDTIKKCFTDRCPDKTAQIEDTKECKACSTNCYKCDEELYCRECDSGFPYLIVNGADTANNNTCAVDCTGSAAIYAEEVNKRCYCTFGKCA